MKIQYYLIILFTFLVGSIHSQSLVTKLLFEQAHTVFKGKLIEIKYEESDADGSAFSVRLEVEQYYKGSSDYREVSFGADKSDAIDLELDTMIMDYGFQIEKGKSYIFFTKRIGESYSPKRGYTQLVESAYEGVPYSNDFEELIQSFRSTYKITTTGTSSIAYSTMMSHADNKFVGQVTSVKSKKNKYHVKLNTLEGKLSISIPKFSCVCKEGILIIGKHYVFYMQSEGRKELRLMDEWLGIVEATDYEKNRFKHGLSIPYLVDKSIYGF